MPAKTITRPRRVNMRDLARSIGVRGHGLEARVSIDTSRAGVLDRGPLPSKYVTVGGTAVHYLHTGPTTLPDAPPALEHGRLFLLLHAAGSNAGLWRRQLEAVGREHSALAPEAIARCRDVVRGRLPQQFTTETFSPATGPDIMREAWTEQVKTDPRVRYTDLLACQAFDGRPLLGQVRTPTLVVAGADDQVTPVACAEELARGIAGARLEVIARAGHQAPLEQADPFGAIVGRFAAELG